MSKSGEGVSIKMEEESPTPGGAALIIRHVTAHPEIERSRRIVGA
jgi:hypothetical protein